MPHQMFQFWEVQISADVEANRKVYEQIGASFTERCGCKNCKVFGELRETIFPSEFLEMLAALGIDFRKEAEVIRYSDLGEQWQGWFNFIGTRVSPEIDRYDSEGEFTWWIKKHGGAVQREFPDEPIASVEWSWKSAS